MLPSNYNSHDPPFLDHYHELFYDTNKVQQCLTDDDHGVIEECELPLIDLKHLRSEVEAEKQACVKAIANASMEWGFFQVLNHEVNPELLGRMRKEQVKLFAKPFEKKVSSGLMNNDSYRWGTPAATSLAHCSWSEAFHVPLAKISGEDYCYGESSSLREVMEKIAGAIWELACMLAKVLAENLGCQGHCFAEMCSKSTCYLRLNRYPPCPFSPTISGLMPHTDSDFLTVLYQDNVGGLQLMKDSKWVAVKPNPDALIVNIGDLFQAWSTDTYKSVEHKVMTNEKMERYSIAFFLCPGLESVVGSYKEPSPYKKFTFGEYRRQVQQDVKCTGQKIGLPRFLL